MVEVAAGLSSAPRAMPAASVIGVRNAPASSTPTRSRLPYMRRCSVVSSSVTSSTTDWYRLATTPAASEPAHTSSGLTGPPIAPVRSTHVSASTIVDTGAPSGAYPLAM